PRHGRNPKVFSANDQTLRSEKWFFAGNAAVAGKLSRSIAGDGLDSPGCRVDSSDAVIRQVRDVDVVLLIEPEAVRLTQPRLPGRAAVAAVPGNPVAGQRGDRPALNVDPADHV